MTRDALASIAALTPEEEAELRADIAEGPEGRAEQVYGEDVLRLLATLDATRKLADEGLAGHGLTLLAAQNVLNEFDYWTSPARPAADGGTVRIHKFNEVQPSMERALDRLRALLLAALAKETT